MQSEQINELAAALSKAQAEIKDAKLDKINPHFKSRYASLESVYASARAVLPKHGICYSHTIEPWNDSFVLITTLMHTSGQWIDSRMPMRIDLTKAQAIGSAITYARRYAMSSIIGIADTEDDDGNAAEEGAKEGDTLISEDERKVLSHLINGDEMLKSIMEEVNKSHGYKSAKDIQQKNYKRYIKAINDYKAAQN